MAIRILSIPANEASMGCIFSAGKVIVGADRHQLYPEVVLKLTARAARAVGPGRKAALHAMY